MSGRGPIIPLGWDSRGTRDDAAAIGLVCPTCAAIVPPGVDQGGESYQRRHITWHEETA